LVQFRYDINGVGTSVAAQESTTGIEKELLPLTELRELELKNQQIDGYSVFDVPTAQDLFDEPGKIKVGQEYRVMENGKWETKKIVGDGAGNVNAEVSRYHLGRIAGVAEKDNPLPESLRPKDPYSKFRGENIGSNDYSIEKTVTVKASYYGKGDGFDGRQTANGERFNANGLTCAHPTLPFGTKIKVTNPDNGLATIVRVNDRGPYAGGRGIDLSYGAAVKIGLVQKGVGSVKLQILKS
jgi:rare lipoprotein A